VLTSPECFHATNVLEGFDREIAAHPDSYVIAACLNASYNDLVDKFEDFKYEMIMWYQHSKHRNRRLHFCSMMPKALYNRIGGFDEGYAKGFGREDVDFVKTIVAEKIKIIISDDIITIHMNHEEIPEMHRLWNINRRYYANKWQAKEAS
jgi:hypothetical protein